jgi:tRNA-2-methylthio-N6-dimethylallyladenosine synthase
MSKKVFIKTFGCQMNEYDSDKMVDVLHAAEGYEATQCRRGRPDPVQHLFGAREGPGEGVLRPRARQAPEEEGRADRRGRLCRQPGGRGDHRPRAICGRGVRAADAAPPARAAAPAQACRAGQQVDISFPEIEKFDHLPPARVEGATAFVSIMEGCSKYCSYCVVPYTRGEEVSRPFDDVLVEVAGLADQGVREVTLLGRTSMPTGCADGRQHRGGRPGDADRVRGRGSGIERIRYTTSHPNEFTPALIDGTPGCPSWSTTCTCRCSMARTAS